MSRNFTLSLLLMINLLAFGCANKFNSSHSINSISSVANLTITDKKGVEIYRGNSLPSKKLKYQPTYFSKDKYLLEFENKGYASKSISVEYKPDGWYFGNASLGENIGLLIIDPVNGAMYKLEPGFFKENLILSSASEEKEEFKIFGINQIPSEWKRNLISLD